MADDIRELCVEFGLQLTSLRDLVKPENLSRLPEPPNLPEHLEKKLTPLSKLLETCDQEKRVARLWTNCQHDNADSRSHATHVDVGNTNVGTTENVIDREKSEDSGSHATHVDVGNTNVGTTENVIDREKSATRSHEHEEAFPVRKMLGEKRFYECSFCGMQKGTRAGVLAHINSSLGRYISCPKCAFKSVNPDCARQHEKCCGKQQFQCDICNFKTNKTSTFKRHALVHSEEKAWQCSCCEKMFKFKFNLDRHRKKPCTKT